MEFSFIFEGIWFILPAYFASSSAVIFGKISKFPIDFKKNFFDGRRIFGENKTFAGFFGGILTGTLISYIQSYFDFFGFSTNVFLGFLISFGAMVGDLSNSFLKRRLNMKSGEKFFPLDQLNLLIGALVFASILKIPSIKAIIFLIFFTIFMHISFNWIGFKLKLKKVRY